MIGKPRDDAERKKRLAAVMKNAFSGLARSPKSGTVRVFHAVESARLSVAARGLLLRLTSEGAITHREREQALNIAMWLDSPDVTDSDMEQILRLMAERKGAAPERTTAPAARHQADPPDSDPRRWN